MKCPFCGHSNTQVLDTRMSEDGDAVRAPALRSLRPPLHDLRADRTVLPGHRQEERLARGLHPRQAEGLDALALRKRPVSAEAIDEAITRIEEKLLALGEKEIPSSQVGELVMRELRKLDKIAYIRFASVYRSFEDVAEFSDVLAEVTSGNSKR